MFQKERINIGRFSELTICHIFFPSFMLFVHFLSKSATFPFIISIKVLSNYSHQNRHFNCLLNDGTEKHFHQTSFCFFSYFVYLFGFAHHSHLNEEIDNAFERFYFSNICFVCMYSVCVAFL